METPFIGNKRFGLNGPRDILDKLNYDVRRMFEAEAIGQAAVAYVGFDCAVTAWCLVDWVYESVDAAHRQRLGASAIGRRDAKAQFAATLCQRVPGLDICYQLATGAKHFIVSHNSRDDLDTSIIKSRSTRLDDVTKQMKTTEKHWPMIYSDDCEHFADEFFAKVSRSWLTFLDAEGIDPR